MNIKPLFDRILVQPIEAVTTSPGGIILSGNAKEKPQYAIVQAVGEGGVVDGKEVKMVVKAGDKVVYGKYVGNEIKLEGVEYVILRQSDILAIIED